MKSAVACDRPAISPHRLVSVVIPTFRRADLVVRAVRTALGQTYLDLEVLVVLDGPDQATEQALSGIVDQRLRVLRTPGHIGHAAARNFGVDHARGAWVAFLDDDDEWLASKLAVQMERAAASPLAYPIVGCRVIARTGRVDLIWPRRTPRAGERLCDYLCRRSLPIAGQGLIQTSMILTRRALFERVRFADGLTRHVDPDWALRAVRVEGAGVIYPETHQPLAIWHIEPNRQRVSTGADWRASLAWGRSRHHLFSREAYAGFICKNVSALAAAAGEWPAFAELLREARRLGRPSWVDLVSHLMNFTLTPAMRDHLWRWVQWTMPRPARA